MKVKTVITTRVLVFILSLAIAAAFTPVFALPQSAKAKEVTDTATVIVGGQTMTIAQNGDTQYATTDKNGAVSEVTTTPDEETSYNIELSYYGSNPLLTLSDATIKETDSGNGEGIAIQDTGAYTTFSINATGDNNITGQNLDTEYSQGISSAKSVAIEGDGSMTVYGGNANSKWHSSYGIYVAGDIEASSSVELAFNSGNPDNTSDPEEACYGVYCTGEITADCGALAAYGATGSIRSNSGSNNVTLGNLETAYTSDTKDAATGTKYDSGSAVNVKYFKAEKSSLAVAGIPVTQANENDILGDGTARYDSSSGTLYLNGATIAGSGKIDYGAGIYYNDYKNTSPLNINLTGTNKVNGTVREYSDAYAIYADRHEISFTGSGSLAAAVAGDQEYTAGKKSIGILGDKIKAAGAVHIDASGGDVGSAQNDEAISAGLYGQDIIISGSAVVKGKGGSVTNSSTEKEASAISCGVYGRDSDLDVSGYAQLTGTGGQAAKSCGIYSYQETGEASENIEYPNVIVSGSGKLTGTGGSGNDINVSYGIYTIGNLNSSGSAKIAGTAGNAKNSSCGIYSKRGIYSGGATQLTGTSTATGGYSYGALVNSTNPVIKFSGDSFIARGRSLALGNKTKVILGSRTKAYSVFDYTGTGTRTSYSSGTAFNANGSSHKYFKAYSGPENGRTCTVGNNKYTVTNASIKGSGTVTLAPPTSRDLTSISIGSTVKINSFTYKITAIKAGAFKKNTKLRKVVIGSNIVSIGKYAFYGDKKLKTITIKSRHLKAVGKYAFRGIYKRAVIKVPGSKYRAYKKLLTKKTGFRSTMKIKRY